MVCARAREVAAEVIAKLVAKVLAIRVTEADVGTEVERRSFPVGLHSFLDIFMRLASDGFFVFGDSFLSVRWEPDIEIVAQSLLRKQGCDVEVEHFLLDDLLESALGLVANH